MNTFTALWINRLDQFGSTDMDLIITHDQGEIPEQRISKSFKMAANLIDTEFLSTIAEDEVERIVAEWEAVNGV